MLKWIGAVSGLLATVAAGAPRTEPAPAQCRHQYVLPRTSLSALGNPACTEDALRRAKANGLPFADLPSIGSGLARAADGSFWGITDRGPNGEVKIDKKKTRRTFPLPCFAPTLVGLDLVQGEIRITRTLPLRDSRGNPVTGLSNLEKEEALFEISGGDPLPRDPGGVDPEAIRVLPDGRFLISEEYSPSILVVSRDGEILVRYTPASKPLTGAPYPVRPILPDVFSKRRDNKGFESLAVSADGKTAWALLQSPMGGGKFDESRVIRALRLDIGNPIEARVTGEFLARASPAADYGGKQEQAKISWSDADWTGPDRLLVLERGKNLSKLLWVDFSKATNILEHKDEFTLRFEEPGADLTAIGVQPAEVRTVFSSDELPQIDSDKIEGVVFQPPADVLLSNDNDFGMGDNKTGEPSRIWLIRLSRGLNSSSDK